MWGRADKFQRLSDPLHKGSGGVLALFENGSDHPGKDRKQPKKTAPFKEGFLNTRSSTFIALGVRAVRVNITAWCKRCINKHGNYKLNYNPSIQRNAPVKPVAVGCFWTAVAVVENPGQAHTAASSTGALGRSSSAPKSKSSRISWRRTEPRQLARKFTEKKETVTRLYFHEWSTKWSTKRAMFHGSQRSTCT